MNRFKGQEQFERYKVLEGRKIWSERNFDIFEHGDYERFERIVQLRGWDKIVHPPSTYNPGIVREFYANALPEGDGPFPYTTMVRGRTIRFDRDAINAYLGNPFTLPNNETLCAYQKQRNRGTWDAQSMRRKLLRPHTDLVYNATQTPLRAMREDMKTFTVLLFNLVMYNIQPNSHPSDAPMNILGLIHYINEDLEIDVAGIISRWMKEIVLSGHTDRTLRSSKVKSKSPLGFPCLIMGLCSANRLNVPQIGNEEIPTINDDYVDRYCKPKQRRARQPPPPPQPP
ncbi:hypothetical protein L195_g053711, partial [Trifolium pratense]